MEIEIEDDKGIRMDNQTSTDILSPAMIAEKTVSTGIQKANYSTFKTFLLAFMAGIFVAFGSLIATTATSGAKDILPYGLIRLITGLTFSFALMMVLIAGSELFTGNILLVMAILEKKLTWMKMIRNWGVVYLGNLVGSIFMAAMVFGGGQYLQGHGIVGLNVLNIAETKTSLGWMQALILGVLCNLLVCLGVWMASSGKTTTDKILAVIPPITVFAAAGFEHSVANMYFIPMGLLVKHFGTPAFFVSIGQVPSDFSHLTIFNFLFNNLLPVTIGNIIGGGVFIGVFYWWVYLRKEN